MEFSREHTNIAKAIAQRAKVRLTTRQNPLDQEMEKFYYWIMNIMFSKVEENWPAKKCNQIHLTVGLGNGSRVMVQNGRSNLYQVPTNISEREFVGIINKLVGFFESTTNYSASYKQEGNVGILVVELNV